MEGGKAGSPVVLEAVRSRTEDASFRRSIRPGFPLLPHAPRPTPAVSIPKADFRDLRIRGWSPQ
ncbi:MAG: hypothetical protein BJ554DRAFT_5478 [Olpidium bornovanus]|uniref:Uncharacterized protein n=1 Tax=Olpidium bornovanus TaxID=278681 RepID=A0A8H7ZZH1_9FUNG|nr:MAG: hypothetical protein BJ554DRAFT_5478 [Olpidium bornovanus]